MFCLAYHTQPSALFINLTKLDLPTTLLAVSHRPPCSAVHIIGCALSSTLTPLPHCPSSASNLLVGYAPLSTLLAVFCHLPCMPCFTIDRVSCASLSVVLGTCCCHTTERSTNCWCSVQWLLINNRVQQLVHDTIKQPPMHNAKLWPLLHALSLHILCPLLL